MSDLCLGREECASVNLFSIAPRQDSRGKIIVASTTSFEYQLEQVRGVAQPG